ncbi:MAG: hypothetical protein MJ214_03555 [Bacilli bacterium]|nr:hypothetical protein [Bacilli bacterium]
MKKLSYLFLLTPALFLITSCQTTPKVDTIDENEARAFINEHYKDKQAATPNTLSTIKWKITKDDSGDTHLAKQYISQYYLKDITTDIPDEQNDPISVSQDACNRYTDHLNSDAMGKSGFDEVIAMNPTIFEQLYKSWQNEPTVSSLTYKHGPNNGLIIISALLSTKSAYTLTHTYDGDGRETEFKIVRAEGGLDYTMTMNFKYNN